ncbi:hypothetical protein FHU10_1856 [Serratia fonticola]|uniref:Uncharacterized protein n=1 Tax=Serratia fonticola TaxID=47917 RepID=A0A559T418_SERFO|nr:hypothetical protein FHU09_0595 [Serratia fonticola]TQI94853.1 hypothetical protein FHU11_0197 [Serratia fonticola]TVZ69351.1 hypothetical protein FHU10_1856 [Serratia fonticola]
MDCIYIFSIPLLFTTSIISFLLHAQHINRNKLITPARGDNIKQMRLTFDSPSKVNVKKGNQHHNISSLCRFCPISQRHTFK